MLRRHTVYVVPLMLMFVLFGLVSLPKSASAKPEILAAWRAHYPQSKSSNVNCQLCHFNPGGGSPWNAYGWSVRQGVVDQGKTFDQAFAAVEAFDADKDGKTNLQEITAGVQPGWTSGNKNIIYAKDGTTQTVAAPNVGRIDIDLPHNPITTTIVSTGSLQISLTTLITGFLSPLYATSTPSLTNDLFVVDQPGQIWRVNLTTGAKSLFLDVSSQLITLGALGPKSFDERGLLGLAFHPNYATNGLLYTFMSQPVTGTVDYTTLPITATANVITVIAQWKVDKPTDPKSVVNPASKKELLRIAKPQFNHNGGGLAFGPDGLLYISLGDGGGADDQDGQPFIGGPTIGHGPTGNAQNKTVVLGKILRIDPLGNNSTNGKYGNPADNPFTAAGDPGLDEIYAYGLRNPFRFSFDKLTGKLYAGDVGQNDIEEIDVITKSGNYGWKFKEGTFFFDDNGPGNGAVTDINFNGAPANLIDPIAQYDHDEGISVTGGFVYRGTQISALKGVYVFGDWSLNFTKPPGRLFYLTPTNTIREFQLAKGQKFGLFVEGFGQDNNGELYVMGNTTGNPFPDANGKNTGSVMRITAASQSLYLPLVANSKK